MNRKILIALGVALAVFGLALFLLRDGPPTPEFEGGGGASGEVGGAASDPLAASTPPGGDDEAGEAAPGTGQEEPPEPPPEPPMLRGLVLGEGQGVPGANVLLFQVAEVEALLVRLERLAPEGSGIPHIPRIIAVIREELQRFRSSARKVTTDEGGAFELRDADPGGYFVLTLADGWLFRYGDVVSLERERTAELTVELERGTSISGRVVDAGGAGLPAVRVIAEYRPPGMPGIGRIVRRVLRLINGEFLKGPFEALSGSGGDFTISSLPTGTYDVTAYDESGMENRVTGVESGSTDVVVYFGEGATLEGHLADGAGFPVPGVRLELERKDGLVSLPLPLAAFNGVANQVHRFLGDGPRSAISAADGSFLLERLAAGKYRLAVEEPGFLSLERPVEVEWGQRHSLGVLRIDRGRTIRGVVRSQGGVPLPESRVMVNRENVSFFTAGKAIKDVMTGRVVAAARADGSFEVSGLGRGPFRVSISKEGFAPQSRKGVKPDGEPIEVFLKPGKTVTGVVLNGEDEKPIAGAAVRIERLVARTDERGRFALEGVVAADDADLRPFGGAFGRGSGRRRWRRGGGEGGEAPDGERRLLSVRVEAKGFLHERAEMDLEELSRDLRFELERAPTIRGVVLDPDGEPAPGSLVRLTPAFPEELEDLGLFDPSLIFLAVGVSDLEGRFAFEGFHAPNDGRFEVVADHVLHARGKSESFAFSERVGGEQEVEVRLVAGAVLKGGVSDGQQPVPGAVVRLRRPRERGPREMMFFRMLGLPKGGKEIHANSRGEFTIDQVIPGEYVLSAEKPGYTDAGELTVSLESGETEAVHLVLDPGGELQGDVEDDLGNPITGARVRVLREDVGDRRFLEAQRRFGGAYKTTVTEEGRFVVGGLPDGRYAVIAQKSGYAKAEVGSVSPGDALPTLVLVPAAAIRASLSDAATGEPVTSFRVNLRKSEDESSGWRGGWREVTDPEGIFERDNLEPGTYEVSLRAAGFVPQSAKVVLGPGAVTEESFAMPPAGRLRGRVVDLLTQRPVAGAQVALATNPRPAKASDEPERGARRRRAAARDGVEPVGKTGEGGKEESGDPRVLRERDRASMTEFFSEAMLGERVATDGEGYFELESVPEGFQTVVVTHADYVQSFRDGVEVELGEERQIDFELRAGLSISGKVVDENGSAVAGRLLFLRGSGAGNDRVRKTRTSDASGRFSISGLEPGAYRLLAPSRGRGGAEPVDLELDDSRSDIEVVVGAASR